MSQQPFVSDNGFSSTGNVTANTFFGNGSQLTGISASTGDIIFVDSTISAPAGDTVIIQALDNSDTLRSQLTMDGDRDVTKLSSWSSRNGQYFDTGSWTTGTYRNDNGQGLIEFTGAQAIIDWLNNNPSADQFSLNVNYGASLPYDGYSSGGDNITFFTTVVPDTDPTTVTTFEIYYQYESKLEIDYDIEEFLIQAVEADLLLETRQNGDIDINSVRNVDMRSNGRISLRNSDTVNGITIQTDTNNTNHTWEFGANGNLLLPAGGTISEGPSPSGLGAAVTITPANGNDANQQLKIYPTVAEGNHLHLTSGDLQVTDIFLGDDNQYVRTTTTGGMVIGTGGGEISGGHAWSFDATGNLTLPASGALVVTTGIVGSGASPAPYLSGFDSVSAVSVSASGNITATGNITAQNFTGNTAGFAIGYRDIPQVSFTGNATIATTDAGKHFYSTQSTNYTLTIANNASQDFQVGAAITIVNQGTGNITIAQDSGVTLYLAGNAAAGNRTVATFGMATIMKVATNIWFVSGAGVA